MIEPKFRVLYQPAVKTHDVVIERLFVKGDNKWWVLVNRHPKSLNGEPLSASDAKAWARAVIFRERKRLALADQHTTWEEEDL